VQTDLATSSQDDRCQQKFVARCGEIHGGVVQYEILEMHEVALKPHRSAGLAEVTAALHT
jgi:hypothetical protein